MRKNREPMLINPTIDIGAVTEDQWKDMGSPKVGYSRFGGIVVSVQIKTGTVCYEVCKSYPLCSNCKRRDYCQVK